MKAHAFEEVTFAPEEPQSLFYTPPPGEAFPVEHLGPLRAAVEAVRGKVQSPVALPAASALAVASLAVQGFADVDTLDGPRPVSLYMLTIARSGERKSSSDAPFMATLREQERALAMQVRTEHAQWENKSALWKNDRDQILRDAKSSKGTRRSSAQADLDELGAEPLAPASPDRTVTEPTFEGLTKLFATGQPSLGIFSDEGGQFLGGHAMGRDNRQKTLAALNDIWQGKTISRTRAGDGQTTLFGRRLALHLMVQPLVARTFMADPMAADTGFLPRFLICEPPSTIGTRLYSNSRTDTEALDAFSARLHAILLEPMPMDAETRALEPRQLALEQRAHDLLVQFHDRIETEQAPGRSLAELTGYASKAPEQAARIAGVLTLWRDLDAPAVTAQDMAKGIALAQFYLAEAKRLSETATISPGIQLAEKLQLWLMNKCEHAEVTVRDICQFGPSCLRNKEKARSALQVLEEHRWVVRCEQGAVTRGQSRKEAWLIMRKKV